MEGLVPIVEVDFGKGMYWSMPVGLSAQVYDQLRQPVSSNWQLAYTWAWDMEGEAPSSNCYVIDVDTMTQTNRKTHRKRRIRIVWVKQ